MDVNSYHRRRDTVNIFPPWGLQLLTRPYVSALCIAVQCQPNTESAKVPHTLTGSPNLLIWTKYSLRPECPCRLWSFALMHPGTSFHSPSESSVRSIVIFSPVLLFFLNTEPSPFSCSLLIVLLGSGELCVELFCTYSQCFASNVKAI